MKLVAARRGRPQKFGRPSRAVTMTLPEDVIKALGGVDDDLGRAVVRLAQPLLADVVHQPAELAKYGTSAIIIVKQFDALSAIGGVSLVPLPDGRALISLDDGMTVHEFELRLRDAIEADSDLEPRERAALAVISEILKSARQTKGIVVQQRNIIVLQTPGRRRLTD